MSYYVESDGDRVPKDVYVCDDSHERILTMECFSEDRRFRLARCIASLLNSHPALLNSCKAIESRLDRAGRGDLQCGPKGKDRDWGTLTANLRAAIAKAEGRS